MNFSFHLDFKLLLIFYSYSLNFIQEFLFFKPPSHQNIKQLHLDLFFICLNYLLKFFIFFYLNSSLF